MCIHSDSGFWAHGLGWVLACSFPTQSQADESVPFIGHLLAHGLLVLRWSSGELRVHSPWRVGEAGNLGVCQSVFNDGGETGGRSEVGGMEQPVWLSRPAAQRVEVTSSQMAPGWYPHFTAAH